MTYFCALVKPSLNLLAARPYLDYRRSSHTGVTGRRGSTKATTHRYNLNLGSNAIGKVSDITSPRHGGDNLLLPSSAAISRSLASGQYEYGPVGRNLPSEKFLHPGQKSRQSRGFLESKKPTQHKFNWIEVRNKCL